MTRLLDVDEVKEIHRIAIEQFGGSHGIRDEGLLDSAVAQPKGSFAGQEFYPTIAEKAAALGFSLIGNHPFIDGNKRAGFAAMAVFLELNGFVLECSDDAGEAATLKVAAGEMTRDELLDWIRTYQKTISA